MAAMAVPAITGWDVHVRDTSRRCTPSGTRASVSARSRPSWSACSRCAGRSTCAARLPWGRLLLAAYGAGLAWMLALALVDGADGIAGVLAHPYEYLRHARRRSPTSRRRCDEFVSRIPYAAEPDNWPVHVAGHPPGALVFFVAARADRARQRPRRRAGGDRCSPRPRPWPCWSPCACWAPRPRPGGPRRSWSSGRPRCGMCVSADAMFAAVARVGAGRAGLRPRLAPQRSAGRSSPGCCWAAA